MLINTTGQLDASTLLFAEQRSVAFVRPSDGGFQEMLARSMQSDDARSDAAQHQADAASAPHHEPARTESPPATVDNGMREGRDDDRAARTDRAAAASSEEVPEGEHASAGSSEGSKVAADSVESERDARTGADSPGERTQKEGDREARLTAGDGQISDGSTRAAASKSSGAQKQLDKRRESAEDDRSDAPAKGAGVGADLANPETDRAKHIELTLDLDRTISDRVASDSPTAEPRPKHSATDAATRAVSAAPGARTRVRPGTDKGDKGEKSENLPTNHGSAAKKPDRDASAEDRRIADRSARVPRDKGTVDRSDRASERVQVEFRPSSVNALTETEQGSGGRQSAQLGADPLDTSQTGRADATGRTGSPLTLRTTAQEASVGLARALSEHGNAEIVRSARLIVRGNDSGEIRLTLRPESLGNVRISLQMHEGHIAGRIIVENQSVREVFEQNLAALERAFQESGLETGALDVSVADSGDRSDGSGDGLGRASARRAAGLFSDAVPGAQWITEEHDLVNMVV